MRVGPVIDFYLGRLLEQISGTSVIKAGPVIDFYLYHLLAAK